MVVGFCNGINFIVVVYCLFEYVNGRVVDGDIFVLFEDWIFSRILYFLNIVFYLYWILL